MHTFHSEECRDEMRGVIPCLVPVLDFWQQHVRNFDILRVDEGEIFVGKCSLAGRFGCRCVILANLLTPPFVWLCAGAISTVFFDLFVSGIRRSGISKREIEADVQRCFFLPHISSSGNLCIIVPVESVGYSCSRASSP